ITIQTRDRAASLEAATKTAVLYNDKLLPLDEISMQSALSGYQAGKLPFIAVLDALHALHDDRVAHMAHLADAAKWRVAIEEASVAPTVMSGTTAVPRAPMSSAPSGAMQ